MTHCSTLWAQKRQNLLSGWRL